MRRLLRGALLVLAILMGSAAAGAHEMTMAEMQVRETAPGQFLWQWTATNELAPAEVLQPEWPEGCVAEAAVLRCGAKGLQGPLSVSGIGKRYSAALVKIFWLDGQSRVYTITAGQPTVQLYGAADDRRGAMEIARAYTILGVGHILTGIDHLLFVIGLLFLVGFNRRLVFTITAFTAAHSLTLASSALGILTLRPPPVEATIALSIALVASEALRDRQTIARRWPAVVAFLFGLVHGLGFAGALKEIGLPENNLWIALLTFNVGVEIGQLFTVGVAWLCYMALRRVPELARIRVAALYLMGTVAAFWSIGRIVTIFA